MIKIKTSCMAYLILATIGYSATTYLHVTVSGADTKDGTTWAKAMDMAAFRDHVQGSVVADTVYYVKSGTYTFGEAITFANPGAATTPIKLIGVLTATTNEGANVVLSDHAFTTNRPVFAMEGNTFVAPAYAFLQNLIFTMGTGNIDLCVLGANGFVINCKSTNSSSTANKVAIKVGNYSNVISSEAISTAGYALQTGTGSVVSGCYIHDSSVRGVYIGGASNTINNSIIDTCGVGVYAAANQYSAINNTLYNCTTGISTTTGTGAVVVNNIISQCTTGIAWTAGNNLCNTYKNNLLNNTTNITEGTLDSSNVAVDVGTTVLTDAANADFTLKSADMTARSKGLMVGVNQGTADKALHVNIGADQTGDFPTAANTLTTDTTDGVPGTFDSLSYLASNAVNARYVIVGHDNYTGGSAGSFVVPLESVVKTGETYGHSSEFTGTYSGGGSRPANTSGGFQ